MKPSETREDGGVLIIALIFVTVMGLVVGALVELASANFRNTASTRTQRKVVYSADAAVQAAINTYKEDFASTGTGTCLGSPPVVNTKQVWVTCSPASTGSSGASSNQPPLAVITLPSTGETGLDTASSGVLNINGGLYSNTNIDSGANSSIHVIGPTTARTGCDDSGSAGRTPPPYQLDPTAANDCALGGGSYPLGSDPGYTPSVDAAPPVVTLPSCPSSGPVIMPAGTYNNVSELNLLFNRCSGHLFYFPPSLGGAVYYFDFTDPGPNHNWTPGTDIVGGTLPAGESLSTVLSLPSGERCDPQKSGVQFIFGGNSRITLTGASVDLCAQHDSSRTKQEIAVYGLSASSYPVSSGFHRQSGCVTTAGGAGCSLVKMTGSNSFFSVAGTVYAPLANFDIQMTGGATRVFGRGAIARSLSVAVTGSSTCGGCSPFSLPPPTAAVATASVVFQASVSSNSNRRLRALVIFYRDGAAPSIQSWSVVNE